MRRTSIGFFFGAALAVAGCGGTTTVTGTGASSGSESSGAHGSSSGAGGSTGSSMGTASTSSGGVSAAQACADEAAAVCKLRDTCSLDSFLNQVDFGSDAVCEMRTAATCVSSLGAKGTGQTPEGIEACVSAFGSYACAAYLEDDPPTACVPPIGMLTTGEACGASGQCASTFCAIAQLQVCGTCQPLPAAGTDCTVDADCGRDLACATPTGAATGKCAAYVASGGMCLTGTAPCGVGLACVGDDEKTKTMGTCQAAGATVGAACDVARKLHGSCYGDLGLVCIPSSAGATVGTCQAIQLVAAGAACGEIGANPITGYAECQAGGLCKRATATALVGTCVAPAADGAPCNSDVTVGPTCLAPAKCVPTTMGGTAGTCTVPDAATCM